MYKKYINPLTHIVMEYLLVGAQYVGDSRIDSSLTPIVTSGTSIIVRWLRVHNTWSTYVPLHHCTIYIIIVFSFPIKHRVYSGWCV